MHLLIVFCVGFPCSDTNVFNDVSSIMPTAFAGNRNTPVTFWIHVLSAFDGGIHLQDSHITFYSMIGENMCMWLVLGPAWPLVVESLQYPFNVA